MPHPGSFDIIYLHKTELHFEAAQLHKRWKRNISLGSLLSLLGSDSLKRALPGQLDHSSTQAKQIKKIGSYTVTSVTTRNTYTSTVSLSIHANTENTKNALSETQTSGNSEHKHNTQ